MPYFITTPIFYVNAKPHLGHAYSMIAADVIARHMRQRGEKVFFLTGTDEHGEPVALAAEQEGVSPQTLADLNAARFAKLPQQLHITNNFFIRTTDPRHKQRVGEVLQRIYDNGYVYKDVYSGWYCPRCADFKTENELGSEDTCQIHKISLERQEEENWFFRLSAFQDQLEQLYASLPEFIFPRQRYNEARSFLGQGLHDVSLSRKALRWGVEVPWDPQHVFYVWFDALLNYYTALHFASENQDLTGTFWPPDCHLMAKDILKFHAIYWPALLLAADLPLPKRLTVHGYLLMDGEKMSKSLGNVLDPFVIAEHFGVDALRYYLVKDVSFGQDGAVSTTAFEERYERELANEFGNLASRIISMIIRYRDSDVPACQLDEELVEELNPIVDNVMACIDRFELSAALEVIWVGVRRLNRYVEERAPWKLAKDPQLADELDCTLASLVEGLRVLTVVLTPWLPVSSQRLLETLGAPANDLAAAKLRQGTVQSLQPIEPLFPKKI